MIIGSLIAAAGAFWVVVIIWDAFEAIVLPRRVTRRLRPTRMFYRLTWRVWSAVGRGMRMGGRRETYLSFYGPLSLLVLIGAWAASLVVGFALLQSGLGAGLNVAGGGWYCWKRGSDSRSWRSSSATSPCCISRSRDVRSASHCSMRAPVHRQAP